MAMIHSLDDSNPIDKSEISNPMQILIL